MTNSAVTKKIKTNTARRAGVLLHPTSLPGTLAFGDIGHEAYRFIEFLSSYGFKVWQLLPLGPTHEDKSPYQCMSVHAGNPMLISLDWLVDRGWLQIDSTDIRQDDSYRRECLLKASSNYYEKNDAAWNKRLKNFIQDNNAWLEDFCVFMALK